MLFRDVRSHQERQIKTKDPSKPEIYIKQRLQVVTGKAEVGLR